MLYTYLCCHRSLDETCERLYTHRNTVLDRIRKIKEDFWINLDTPEKHLKYLLSAAVILVKNGETEMFVTDSSTYACCERYFLSSYYLSSVEPRIYFTFRDTG